MFKNVWNEFLHNLKENYDKELLEIAKSSTYETSTLSQTYLGENIIFTILVNRIIFKQFKEQMQQFTSIAVSFFQNLEIDNINISKVMVSPIYETFVDWDALSGQETKESFISKVKTEINVLLSIIVGTPQVDESIYIQNHNYLVSCSKTLGLEYPNSMSSYDEITAMYSRIASGTGAWAIRRKYVKELYENYVKTVESSFEEEKSLLNVYKPTGWALIDRDIKLMYALYIRSENPIEYKAVGNMLRDILIKVAQQVYIDDLHHPSDYPGSISINDYKRMLDGYFESKYHGDSNKEYRNYSKKAMELAHKLTHGDSVEKFHVNMGVDACLLVVRLVELTEKNT